jgi:hypothetical protein
VQVDLDAAVEPDQSPESSGSSSLEDASGKAVIMSLGFRVGPALRSLSAGATVAPLDVQLDLVVARIARHALDVIVVPPRPARRTPGPVCDSSRAPSARARPTLPAKTTSRMLRARWIGRGDADAREHELDAVLLDLDALLGEAEHVGVLAQRDAELADPVHTRP